MLGDAEKVPVALVGRGRWGKILLGELKKLAEVVYECDSKTDLRAVFDDPNVKAVFIATPTETHFDIASMALGAGKHVFLEKPGTDSSSGLETLVAKARGKKIKLTIGYEFPHHPAARKIKELTRGKRIKGLYFVWQKWGTFKDNIIPNLLSHEVSIMVFFGFNHLTPASIKKIGAISGMDILETEFRSSEGMSIKSVINRISASKQKTVTVILDDEAYVWNDSKLMRVCPRTQILEEIDLPNTTPVSAEIHDFLSAIGENRDPLTHGDFGLEVLRITEKTRLLADQL